MKLRYFLITAFLLSSALLYFGCSAANNSGITKFTISDPSVVLTDAQLATLGAAGLDGTTEAETAANILTWQKAKMLLVTPADYPDVSYPMRWNYIMPGIYPVNEMITARTTLDAGTTKIYGVCWDFAAIYLSVAKKYHLTTRMTAYKTYISGVPGGESGMGPAEYDALKVKLLANGLNFTYDQIRSAAKETWAHYRAEVKLGSAWVAFDGASPTGDYLIDSNYSVVNLDDGADPTLTQK
jgi:transglutaminase-like putative cysteine protease